MSLKTSTNKGYLAYSFRRSFPYTLIMAISLLAVNICIYSLGEFAIGNCVDVQDISWPTMVLMYVIPVILGCWQFKFLFSRPGSDFYGALPMTRSAMFAYGFLNGILSIGIIIGVNFLYFALIYPFRLSASSLMSPMIPVWYFISWFACYAAVFALVAFAATLSGTLPAQMVLSFVIAFVPGAILSFVQMELFGSMSVAQNFYDGSFFRFQSADRILRFLFAPYYPIQMLTFEISGLTVYTGSFYDLKTPWMFLVNTVIAALFLFGGCSVLRKRKFEITGTAFFSEKFYHVVKGLVILPFLYLLFRLIIEEFELSLFILLFVLITVFYIVMDIILRKRLCKIGSSTLVYLGTVGITALLVGGIVGAGSGFEKQGIPVEEAKISEVTVYLEPAGMSLAQARVPFKAYRVPLTFDDPVLLEALREGNDTAAAGEYWFMDLTVNGKKVTGRFHTAAPAFRERLAELLDSDAKYRELLDYSDKRRKSNSLATIAPVSDRYSRVPVPESAMDRILSLIDAKNEQRTLSDRCLGTVSDEYSDYSFSAYEIPSGKNVSLQAVVTSYIHGIYMSEDVFVDESMFRDIAVICNENAAARDPMSAEKGRWNFISAENSMGKADFGSNFNSLLVNMISNPNQYLSSAKETGSVPASSSDTVLLQHTGITNVSGSYYYFLSYEKCIKPALESYLSDCGEKVKSTDSVLEQYLSADISLISYGQNVYRIYNRENDSPLYREQLRKMLALCSDPSLYSSQGLKEAQKTNKPIILIELHCAEETLSFFGILQEEAQPDFIQFDYNFYDGCGEIVLDMLRSSPVKMTVDNHPLDLQSADPDMVRSLLCVLISYRYGIYDKYYYPTEYSPSNVSVSVSFELENGVMMDDWIDMDLELYNQCMALCGKAGS